MKVFREVHVTDCPGIYAIIHLPTGGWYIGSSTCIKQRWTEHRSLLNRGKSKNPKLQKLWAEDGPDAFEFEVLEVCEIEELIEREQHYLDTYDCILNVCTAAGNSRGTTHSAETKVKMREAKLGKKQTAEHIEKRQASQRGQKRPKQTESMLKHWENKKS